ncbi:MAG: hypothetical protein OFPI_44000 [Osedax symbiont Rs2]|nr:MAG: hypothetical protein OFPI_44000 [Osedax symbiont Rs2]
MATKINGSSASPTLWPSVTIEMARPLFELNQREVAVNAFCVIMPCPNKRSI